VLLRFRLQGVGSGEFFLGLRWILLVLHVVTLVVTHAVSNLAGEPQEVDMGKRARGRQQHFKQCGT
jgi:hypothetical protein